MIWRTTPAEWAPLPSAIDGIHHPNIEIVDGGGGRLSVLVSEWRNGECKKAFSVKFEPEAYCSVDETIYSIRSRDKKLNYDHYLHVADLGADLSGLIETQSMLAGREITLKNYLLVGLSECLEVVSENPPRVTAHSSYDAARDHGRSRETAS